MSQWENVAVGNCRVGKCLGGKLPRGKISGWEIVTWDVVRWEIVEWEIVGESVYSSRNLFNILAFLSRDDDNPSRVNYFRSTAWTGQTTTTHTALNTEQNQLAIKVSADN